MALLQKMTTFNGDHTNSKVYLGFAGDFDVDEITSIIGLKPTHFHNKGDKKLSIVNKDGSTAYYKFSVWDYGTEYEYTRDIDEQCERIVNQLINKQAEIISIVEKYNCTVIFQIVSVIEKGKTPGLGISQNVMNFCTAIKADIDIDIYALSDASDNIRVSTQSQDLARQLDLLNKQGCEEILTEKMTGTKTDRPELNRLKNDKLRSGDTVIIESFSRLGRSTKDLIELVEWFDNKGVTLISLKENFDAHTPQGKLMLTVFQAFSQFERDLIVQRTKEGLESARTRGRKGGRPKKNPKNIDTALKMYYSKQFSIKQIYEATKVPATTLYRYKALQEPMKVSVGKQVLE